MGFDAEEGSLGFFDIFSDNKAPLVVESRHAETKGIAITLTPFELEVYRIEGERN